MLSLLTGIVLLPSLNVNLHTARRDFIDEMVAVAVVPVTEVTSPMP